MKMYREYQMFAMHGRSPDNVSRTLGEQKNRCGMCKEKFVVINGIPQFVCDHYRQVKHIKTFIIGRAPQQHTNPILIQLTNSSTITCTGVQSGLSWRGRHGNGRITGGSWMQRTASCQLLKSSNLSGLSCAELAIGNGCHRLRTKSFVAIAWPF